MRRKHWIVCDDSDGERTGVRRYVFGVAAESYKAALR